MNNCGIWLIFSSLTEALAGKKKNSRKRFALACSLRVQSSMVAAVVGGATLEGSMRWQRAQGQA